MDNKQWQAALLAVVLIVGGLLLVLGGLPGPVGLPPEEPVGGFPDGGEPGTYLFCFWNVENLFDDRDDQRTTRGDREYDSYFSHNEAARTQKLHNLCDVLVPLNHGKGPDILGICEVESLRAAEMLRDALNRRLTDPALHYTTVLYEDPGGGRNIAPALLTRLPVEKDRTQLLGRRLRILETRLRVAGQPLTLITSHWSSRVSDKTGATRARYADAIHGRFRQMWTANRKVDLLVCGDFNDNPDDPSVTEHLHAVGDEEAVRQATNEPMLFNAFARLYREGKASHYYGPKPYLFDQVCVSPGMLDRAGWSLEVSSAQVVPELATREGRPNRFGGESDRRRLEYRGASDHFPVTVRLTVTR